MHTHRRKVQSRKLPCMGGRKRGARSPPSHIFLQACAAAVVLPSKLVQHCCGATSGTQDPRSSAAAPWFFTPVCLSPAVCAMQTDAG